MLLTAGLGLQATARLLQSNGRADVRRGRVSRFSCRTAASRGDGDGHKASEGKCRDHVEGCAGAA